MKTFMALTFIGILTCVYAKFVIISKCEEPKPMEAFSATQFFSGTWYVTHVKNVTSPTVCLTFNTSQEDDKFIVQYGLNKIDDEANDQLRCEARREDGVKKLSFVCTLNNDSIFQSDIIVMGTDYKNYAVFYNCVIFEGTGSKADNYLVLSRQSGNEEIPDKAKCLTEKLDLKKCSELTSCSK